MNERIGKENSLVCISRPRRFGKSYAAKRLTAYYDCSCDSHELFKDKKIAKAKDFEKYLNQFNVICLDITGFTSAAKDSGVSLREVPGMIKNALWKDLVESGFVPKAGDTLNDFMLRCVESENGRPFIFIILNKKYTYGLENYGCPILLVGITYDKDAEAGKKKHKCKIVEYAK